MLNNLSGRALPPSLTLQGQGYHLEALVGSSQGIEALLKPALPGPETIRDRCLKGSILTESCQAQEIARANANESIDLTGPEQSLAVDQFVASGVPLRLCEQDFQVTHASLEPGSFKLAYPEQATLRLPLSELLEQLGPEQELRALHRDDPTGEAYSLQLRQGQLLASRPHQEPLVLADPQAINGLFLPSTQMVPHGDFGSVSLPTPSYSKDSLELVPLLPASIAYPRNLTPARPLGSLSQVASIEVGLPADLARKAAREVAQMEGPLLVDHVCLKVANAADAENVEPLVQALEHHARHKGPVTLLDNSLMQPLGDLGPRLQESGLNLVALGQFPGGLPEQTHRKNISSPKRAILSTSQAGNTEKKYLGSQIVVEGPLAQLVHRYETSLESGSAPADLEQRRELVDQLAQQGVFMMDPFVRRTDAFAAQLATIGRAQHTLLVEHKHLDNPLLAAALVAKACEGVAVQILTGTIDPRSQAQFDFYQEQGQEAPLEIRRVRREANDQGPKDPRVPHHNVIVADLGHPSAQVSVSTAYFSSQQMSLEDTSAYELTVNLSGEAAQDYLQQFQQLHQEFFPDLKLARSGPDSARQS